MSWNFSGNFVEMFTKIFLKRNSQKGFAIPSNKNIFKVFQYLLFPYFTYRSGGGVTSEYATDIRISAKNPYLISWSPKFHTLCAKSNSPVEFREFFRRNFVEILIEIGYSRYIECYFRTMVTLTFTQNMIWSMSKLYSLKIVSVFLN